MKRGRLAIAVAAVLVLAGGAVLTITELAGLDRPGTARTAPSRPSQRSSPFTPGSTGTPGSTSPAADSLEPAAGAYLGAYVQPARYDQQAQIQAFVSFERQLAHPLEIVHVYHPWGTKLPSAADAYFANRGKILLLTWGGDPDTKAIIAGRDNAMIAATARAVKALRHPVMLEFRHEMDRPDLQWTIQGPADYIRAFDHIRAIFAAMGATNVSWVWCPTGLGFGSGRAQPFYPGDREVDWLCADVYATSPGQSLSQAAAPFLTWAAHHDKPVIIGEYGDDASQAGWVSWLAAAGRLARSDRQIKAMVYFDARGTDASGHTYDLWLQNRPAALAAFASLARQPYFNPAVPHDR